MDENKQFILIVSIGVILIVSGFLTNVLEKFSLNSFLIPFLVIGILGYLSYNFKTKSIRKIPLILTILSVFILIEKIRESITLKVGEFIFSPNSLLGFLLVFFLCYILLIDYLKFKTIMSRSYFFLIIILFLIFKNSSTKLGSFIYDKIPIVGAILGLGLIYIIYKDFKKYQKILPRAYFIFVMILVVIFREKLSPLKWIESVTSYIFKGAGSHALTIGLIIILFVQILFYYILWKPKKEVEKLEYI